MYKKLTIIIAVIFAALLFYVASRFNAVNNLKLANANDVVPYYEAALEQFWHVGIVICLVSWLWVNIVVIKIKQFFWLWLPFLLIVFVAITNSYQVEQLFHFKKANGLWKGGFSLSYFFGVGIIFIAAVAILINYFLLKKYFKKEKIKQ